MCLSPSLLERACCLLVFATLAPRLRAQATVPAVNLGSVAVGSSTTATVTFTYTGAAAITGVSVLTQGVAGLDFAQAGDASCVQAAPVVGSRCTVGVKFTPGAPGVHTGAVELATSEGPAAGGVGMISGTGIGGQFTPRSGTRSAITETRGFSSLSALTTDAAGNLYVASSGNGSVYKETISGTVATQTTITTALGQAGGMAIDGAGNLFVASPTQKAVYEFPYTASTGTYASAPTTIRYCVNACWSVAIDPSGNLFVGETTTVYEAALHNGGYPTFTQLVTGYSNVTGLAVDAFDNLYIADNLTVSVQTLANGAYTKMTLDTGLTSANGVALDAAGDIYVSDKQYSYVLDYEPNGSGGYTKNFITSPATSGVALTSTGQLYVNDSGTNLYEIDMTTLSSSTSSSVGYNSPGTTATITNTAPLAAAGAYIYKPSAPAHTTETSFPQVLGNFAVSGIPAMVYSGTAYTFTVTARDTTGAVYTGFTGVVTLTSTDAAASLSPSNYIFSAADAGVHTFTVIFNTAGMHSVTATTSGGISGSETGIPVEGYIWLLNANGATVKLTAGGTTVISSVGTSSAAGTMGGLAADAAGTIWSVTPSSNMLDSVNYSGTGAAMYSGGGLNAPCAVAVDGAGAVWIANSAGNSVTLFAKSGNPVSPTTGFTGYQGASYGAPAGIAIDGSGNVWVSNSSTNTVTEILGAAAPAAPASTAFVNSTTGARP